MSKGRRFPPEDVRVNLHGSGYTETESGNSETTPFRVPAGVFAVRNENDHATVWLHGKGITR